MELIPMNEAIQYCNVSSLMAYGAYFALLFVLHMYVLTKMKKREKGREGKEKRYKYENTTFRTAFLSFIFLPYLTMKQLM